MSDDKEMWDAFEKELAGRSMGSFTTRELLRPFWQAAWIARGNQVSSVAQCCRQRPCAHPGKGPCDLAASASPPHRDDVAIDQFAYRMKAKMAASRAKGRSGWEDCSPADLSRMLREHVEKGDPVDVANFCMMLYMNGDSIVRPAAQADAEDAAPVAWMHMMTFKTGRVICWPTLDNRNPWEFPHREFEGCSYECRPLGIIKSICQELKT